MTHPEEHTRPLPQSRVCPRPWVTHYRKRKTNRTARCGMVTPPDHHRCRWPCVPGTDRCRMHTEEIP